MKPDQGTRPTHGRGAGVGERTLQTCVLLVVLVLVAAPIAPVVMQSFSNTPLYDGMSELSLGGYWRALSSSAFQSAMVNTAIFATLATLIAQVVGVLATILVARTNLPGARGIMNLMLWPIYVSHLVLAFGWIVAYGPSGFVTLQVEQIIGWKPWNLYSLAGLSIAAGLSLAPLTFLYSIGAARTIDPALEDAARLSGAGPIKTLAAITLPLLRPAIVTTTILNFVLALELFVMPLLLAVPSGMHFLTTFIYAEGFEASTPDHALVSAVAVMLIGVVTVLVLLQMHLVGDGKRFVTVGGKAGRARLLDLGWWRWPCCIALLAYLFATVLLVMGGLVVRSFASVLSPFVPLADVLTLDNYQTVFSFPAYVRSIWNTLGVAVLGALVGTVLVTACAFVALRSDYKLRRPLEFIALYPRAIPGLLVGMGVLWATAWLPGMAWMQNTIAILIFAFVMRHLPTGYGAIQPALLQISGDHDRSARSVGASWLQTCLLVLAPQLRPALFACYAILFIHFIKEYAVAVFLFGPGSEVMGTTMLSFWVQGENGSVAALAVIQMAIIAVFMVIFRYLIGVRNYG
ncbi:ABC transporter permease [Pollutimonas bauzanensis]|uniref:Iron(III) transport system permease protein n=1 Tax=Pollutimonas bauzanensis TaxID=658167 RepID=A0A1M5UX78_9BURK|nr:iron ABC transporter permease [Pollutimonas bauzanensis]SHH67498.1 iron(III) transport system permease protein [Pollutimonas bauzanensis]